MRPMTGRIVSMWTKFTIRVAIGTLLIISSVGSFLFGNGLYIYRDWSWPLSTSITPRSHFSPLAASNAGPDPFGFTRMFYTWPIYVIDEVFSNPILSEKIFVVYLFSVLIFLAFVFSILFLRLLNQVRGEPLTAWRAEIFTTFVVIFCFANFWSLDHISDLYYTSMTEFLLVAISAVYIFLRKASLNSVAVSGVCLSFCILLDPDFYVFGLMTLAIVILASTVSRSSHLASIRRLGVKILALTVLTVPALITALYALNETSGTNLRTPDSYQAFTSNLSLANAVRLLGYWWSLIIYAPPSVLNAGSVSQAATAGSPPFMILPPGPVTTIWLATTWVVPVFAFSTLVISRFRRLSVTMVTVALLGLLMTQASIFTLPHLLATEFASTPVLGGALATIFAIPDHILFMVALAYVILVPIGVFSLLRDGFNQIGLTLSTQLALFSNFRGLPKIPRVLRATIVASILIFLIFPAWQFFSGSFFPAGYTPGIQGNGIPEIGAFTPSQPPQIMFDVYNWLLSQPGNFNVYWPGADGATYPWSEKSTPSITWIDSPRPTLLGTGTSPTLFPSGLQYLLSSNLTSDIASYLGALNIRYIVVQPYSEKGLFYSWGISNYTKLQDLIQDSPGISRVSSEGDVTVYAINETWGPIYSANIVVGYGTPGNEYAIAYNALASLGTKVAVVGPQSSSRDLCFDSFDCSVSILSPNYLSGILPSQISLAALQQTQPKTNFTLSPSMISNLPPPDANWTLANWGENSVDVSLENSMQWFFSGESVATLSYNGTVSDNRPGGIIVRPGDVPTLKVAFSYRNSNNSDISLHVLVPTLNAQLKTVSSPASGEFNNEETWTRVSYDALLPPGPTIFTARIQAAGSKGWIELRDVNLNVSIASFDGESPFGSVLHLNGSHPSDFLLPNGFAYVQARGSGLISRGNKNFAMEDQQGLEWLNISDSFGQLIVMGNIGIASIIVAQLSLQSPSSSDAGFSPNDSVFTAAGGAVVYARTFDRGYSLSNGNQSLSPVSTLDGLNLFLGVSRGTYRIGLSSVLPMFAAYLLCLVANFIVLFIIFRKKLTKRKVTNPSSPLGPDSKK